jgi:glycosyltransferase involved in cell wall biosynthesis
LTVSSFSKSEIRRVFRIKDEKIAVLGNAWQHINRISPDDRIFKKNKRLKKGEYLFSASSLTPQKNFNWIIAAARRNPQNIFAIAGKKISLSQKNNKTDGIDNLLYLGYVSDREMKSLMQNCKAFIHPALYEGFGIPPLEALSVGTKIIVSKSSCLPEIFENSAYYIDPYNPDINIDDLLQKTIESPDVILAKYSWEKHAMRLFDILKVMQNG